MSRIYTQNLQGQVVEIQNWYARKSPDDVALYRALDPAETTSYQQCKSAGQSDSDIWRALHPNWRKPEPRTQHSISTKIELPVTFLKKKQLIQLLEKALGTQFSTLCYMSKHELQLLFVEVMRNKQVVFGS